MYRKPSRHPKCSSDGQLVISDGQPNRLNMTKNSHLKGLKWFFL